MKLSFVDDILVTRLFVLQDISLKVHIYYSKTDFLGYIGWLNYAEGLFVGECRVYWISDEYD